MDELKSSEHSVIKFTSPSDTDCQLDLGAEIELDQIGSTMSAIDKKFGTFNNRLPQRNSGFEKKNVKGNRAKPQMLGNLTFREIAEKRKDMLKSVFVKRKENVPSSTPTSVNESSSKPDKKEEGKLVENVTTYINPYLLVGKTITLKQGEIRRIKFLSQDSSPSNSQLLKLDALQLTPEIIVRKSKPKFMSSQETSINHKDLGKPIDCIKMRKRIGTPEIDNSVEKRFHLRSKSLPPTHRIAYDHIVTNSKLEHDKCNRKSLGLIPKKVSSDKKMFDCNTEDFVDVISELGGEKVTKCSLLSSSHDNLTILSQVACGELEINEQFINKDEADNSHKSIKSFHEFDTLNNSLSLNNKKANEFHLNLQSIKVRTKNNKICPRQRVKNTTTPYSQIYNNKSKDCFMRPMFAWCTQYITNNRSYKTTDDCDTIKHQLALKQQILKRENRKLSQSQKCGEIKSAIVQNIVKVHSIDNSISQHNVQTLDEPYKKDKVNMKTLNTTERLNRVRTTKTHRASRTNGKVLSKPITEPCVKSGEFTMSPLLSSNEENSLSEENNDIFILKEILITKSPSISALHTKESDILRQELSKELVLPTTFSKTNSIHNAKTSSWRKILTEILVNEGQTSKNIEISNEDNKSTEPCSIATKRPFKSLPPDVTTEAIKDNIVAKKIRVVKKASLKVGQSQPLNQNNYALKCNSTFKSEDTIKEASIGKSSCQIKKCFVLIERLDESFYVFRKDGIIGNNSKRTDIDTMGHNGNSSFDTSLAKNRDDSKVVRVLNYDGKFIDEEQREKDDSLKNQILFISSKDENMRSGPKKVESTFPYSPLSSVIYQCKGNSKDCNRPVVLEKNSSTLKKCFRQTEPHDIDYHSVISRENKQESADCNSVICSGNDNNSLHEEGTGYHENNFDGKKCGNRNLMESNSHTGYKRKSKFSNENCEDTTDRKEVKQPRGRLKKQIKNQTSNITKKQLTNRSVEMKKDVVPNLPLDARKKISTKCSRENSSQVKRFRGRPKKPVINQGFNQNQTTYMKNSKEKVKTKLQGLRMALKTDILEARNFDIVNQSIRGIRDQNNEEIVVSNEKHNAVKLTPEKTFSGSREIYSLLTDFKKIGCTIEPVRKLRRSLNGQVKSVENPKYLKYSADEFILNENNTSPIICNEELKNCVVTQSEDHTSLCICGKNNSRTVNFNHEKSPVNDKFPLNTSPAIKSPKRLSEENTRVSKRLGKKTNEGKLKKRRAAPKIVPSNQKKLNISISGTKNKQDNDKLSKAIKKTRRNNIITVMKCPHEPNSVIKSCSFGKNNSVKLKNKTIISPITADCKKQQTSEWDEEDVKILQDNNYSNQQLPKNLRCDHADEDKNRQSSSLSDKRKLHLSRFKRQNLRQLSRSPLLNSKQNPPEPPQEVQTLITSNDNKDNKKCFGDNEMLVCNSSKHDHKLISLKNCSVSLDIDKEQTGLVTRATSNSAMLDEKKIRKSNSDCQILFNKKFGQKVTKTQHILKYQSSEDNMYEVCSTTRLVKIKETDHCNEFVKFNIISCSGLKQSTESLTPYNTNLIKNSETNNQCICSKGQGCKCAIGEWTFASPLIQIQSVDSHTGIKMQVNDVKTKVQCGLSGTNKRLERDESTNSVITNELSVRDKVRLLIMDQLKRSKRSHKIVIEKVTPKR